MRGTEALDIKPWMLPLIVIALVVPITVVAILVGPAGAFAAGFLVTAAVAVIAVRMRFDRDIEVAPSPDDRHRALIVCLTALDSSWDARHIATELGKLAEAFDSSGRSLVLVPASNRRISEWLSDVDPARAEARRRLETSLAHLSAAGVEAEGRVGEDDVVQTIEDTLRGFPARDVVLVTDERGGDGTVGELRRRLDRPLRVVHL